MLDLLKTGDSGWGDEIVRGTLVTIKLALAALPLGLAIGFVVAFALLSHWRPLRIIGVGYSVILRALPELLTLFVVYYGLGFALNSALRAIDPGAGPIEFDPFAAGVLALGMVFGAYAGEVLRGAFQALDPGQSEAGRAVGMNERTIFLRIRLPQVWRFALPGLGNLWVGLLKDTSLVSVITLNELMRMSQVAARTTKQPFFFFLLACAVFLTLCAVSELLLDRFERRANRATAFERA